MCPCEWGVYHRCFHKSKLQQLWGGRSLPPFLKASAFTSELKLWSPFTGGGLPWRCWPPTPAVLGDYLVCSQADLMDVFVGYFLNVWAEEVKHLFIYISTTDRNCLIKEINIRLNKLIQAPNCSGPNKPEHWVHYEHTDPKNFFTIIIRWSCGG